MYLVSIFEKGLLGTYHLKPGHMINFFCLPSLSMTCLTAHGNLRPTLLLKIWKRHKSVVCFFSHWVWFLAASAAAEEPSAILVVDPFRLFFLLWKILGLLFKLMLWNKKKSDYPFFFRPLLLFYILLMSSTGVSFLLFLVLSPSWFFSVYFNIYLLCKDV